jgi:hypothetical protein
MKNPSVSRAFSLVLLLATTAPIVGCASSKLTSAPQATSTSTTPTKEYEYHDMSTGRFFGTPLQTTAQAQQAQKATQ